MFALRMVGMAVTVACWVLIAAVLAVVVVSALAGLIAWAGLHVASILRDLQTT